MKDTGKRKLEPGDFIRAYDLYGNWELGIVIGVIEIGYGFAVYSLSKRTGKVLLDSEKLCSEITMEEFLK